MSLFGENTTHQDWKVLHKLPMVAASQDDLRTAILKEPEIFILQSHFNAFFIKLDSYFRYSIPFVLLFSMDSMHALLYHALSFFGFISIALS